MSFEANRGQAAPGIKFLARGGGYTLALWPTEAALTLSPGTAPPRRPFRPGRLPRPTGKPALLRMKLVGAAPALSAGRGEAALPGKVNYLIGKDPRRWRRNVPTYRKVRFPGVYPGIDLVYYGSQRQLEYDFLVAPGADPSKIGLEFVGARRARVAPNGDLSLRLAGGEVRLHKPVIYQEDGSGRRRVEGGFRKTGKNRVAFRVGAYDKTKPLVIDPVLVYSTYLGGAAQDIPTETAVDGSGSAYLTGNTTSLDFPTQNPFQPAKGSATQDFEGLDAFVLKLNPAGTALEYATYLGGSKTDQGTAIAVDSAGNAYVGGSTVSDNFPVTKAFRGQKESGSTADGFLTVLNPAGTALVYSSYLGGSLDDAVADLTIDPDRNVYLTGSTSSFDFPVVKGPNNSGVGSRFFLTKVSPPVDAAPASLAYSFAQGSTTFELNPNTYGVGVAVDGAGNAFVTGSTTAKDFPRINTVVTSNAGSDDAFVAEIAPPSGPPGQEKVSFVYCTLLGGGGQDLPRGIGLDSAGNAYVAGTTYSDNFPVTNAAFQKTYGGGFGDAFAAKFVTPTPGQFVTLGYATYLGKAGSDSGNNVAVNADGEVYVVGSTVSTDFFTLHPLQASNRGGLDVFLTRLDALGLPEFSTYLGGTASDDGAAVAFGAPGEVFVAGRTFSGDFPRTGTPLRPMDAEGQAFISKINVDLDPTFAALGVFPSRAGDKGECSVVIKGRGFVEGATVKLVRAGQTEIPGKNPLAGGGGTRLAATFELTQRAQGPWDVVVTNPDGNSLTLPGGFTIEPARDTQVWVDVIGSPNLRVGKPGTYTVLFGNRGNVNAVAIPVWITGIPKNVQVGLVDTPAPLPQLPGDTYDYSQIPEVLNGPDGQFMMLMAPLIPPGATGYFRFRVTVTTQQAFSMNVWAGGSLLNAFPAGGLGPLQSTPSPTPEQDCINQAFTQLLKFALNKLVDKIAPTKCVGESLKAVQTVINEVAADAALAGAGNFSNGALLTSMSKMLTAGLKAGLRCAETALEIAVPEAALAVLLYDTISNAIDLAKLIDKCKDMFGPQNPKSQRIQPVNAKDPNDKFGSVGAGEGHYLSPSEPLRYTIQFENKPDATAPAQDVVVTDPLDKVRMDLSTFTLGPITFGDHVVVPEPYSSSFTTDVDLPDRKLLLRITAGVDLGTGVATWAFQSLDPVTKQPTEDPLAGFLPPNQTPPEGEGSVLFTVQPKAGLTTGTQIKNKASIVFDVNAPIETPEWLNTLDASLPTSKVDPVGDLSVSRFKVEWGGTDEGSGVGGYTVYVAEGEGAFSPWRQRTTDTSDLYGGLPGKSYRFYSIAEDQTGNREGDKAAADVTVMLPADAALIGDVNLDKQVDVGDAVEALRHVVGLAELSAVQLKAGDVNADAAVDVVDAVDILRKVVGLDSSF